jgi:hypothetical protein
MDKDRELGDWPLDSVWRGRRSFTRVDGVLLTTIVGSTMMI